MNKKLCLIAIVAQAMIEAGATRIGTSSGIKMAEELAAQQA